MLINNLLVSEINHINETSKQLLANLKETSNFLGKPDLNKLREHFKEQECLSNTQSKQILDLREILNSTHCKSLSEFAINSQNEDLIRVVFELKKLMYEIVVTTNQNKKLLEDCSRITNTQLNLIIGKKQEPTNYNFSPKNINAHLLQQLKSTT